MRAIGIVLAGGNSKRMRELSNKRAIAAMPIAGSYRSVDFALSNMSNSHIQSVAQTLVPHRRSRQRAATGTAVPQMRCIRTSIS